MLVSNALLIARFAAIFSICAVAVSPPLANAGLLVCLLAFLSSAEARDRFVFVIKEPLGIATLVMFGSLIIGLSYGTNTLQDALGELYKNRFWILIPVFASLFFELRSKRDLAVSYVLFCGSAALLSLVFWMLDYSPRHNAPGILLRDHVTQGMALAVGAFAGAFLMLNQREHLSAVLRSLVFAAIAVSLINVIYVSIGRSGHVALVALSVYGAWKLFKNRKDRWLVLSVLGLVVVGVLSSSMIRERFKLGVSEINQVQSSVEPTSIGLRVTFWTNTLELIKERPFFGHGTGGFDDAYARRVKDSTDWRAVATDDPHNQYLFTLAERGVVGLVALIAMLWLLIRQSGGGEPWRDLALGVVLAWCFTNLVNSHFHTFNQSHFFVMWVGAFLAPIRPSSQ